MVTKTTHVNVIKRIIINIYKNLVYAYVWITALSCSEIIGTYKKKSQDLVLLLPL